MYPNGINAYRNNSVNHSSKEQLLLMIVDGAVKFSKIAREALINKDVKKSHEYLVKTQDIFTELMVTLDQNSGDWAVQLFKIYGFIKEKLGEANITKKVEVLDQAMPLIEEVRDMWYEANKMAKLGR